MSKDINDDKKPIGVLSNEELIKLLIKHNNLHEGKYALTVEFQIAVGAIGASLDTIYPGAMIGVSGIGLSRAENQPPESLSVDAAEINPLPSPKARASTKKTAIKTNS